MRSRLMGGSALALVLAAGACGHTPDWDDSQQAAICVDRQGNRVADSECASQVAHGGGSPFLWYYLGRSSTVPPVGGRISGGGSYARDAGVTYSRAPSRGMESVAAHASVSRGGFGESAHGFGGFGGE